MLAVQAVLNDCQSKHGQCFINFKYAKLLFFKLKVGRENWLAISCFILTSVLIVSGPGTCTVVGIKNGTVCASNFDLGCTIVNR